MRRRSSSPEALSAPVTTNQSGIHPRLARAVLRHQRSPSRRPVALHTVRAFAAADARVRTAGCPVVLDSGCGTGESTFTLAAGHPDALVVGIDKSAARLGRARPAGGANALLVRAELGDFWRLARRHRWPVAKHYLLYPNPWPNRRHLSRRWHAHPALTDLLALGGTFELRTNWRLYAEEFAHALALLGIVPTLKAFTPAQALSAFERKYAASGHSLYRLTADLGAAGAPCGEGPQWPDA